MKLNRRTVLKGVGACAGLAILPTAHAGYQLPPTLDEMIVEVGDIDVMTFSGCPWPEICGSDGLPDVPMAFLPCFPWHGLRYLRTAEEYQRLGVMQTISHSMGLPTGYCRSYATVGYIVDDAIVNTPGVMCGDWPRAQHEQYAWVQLCPDPDAISQALYYDPRSAARGVDPPSPRTGGWGSYPAPRLVFASDASVRKLVALSQDAYCDTGGCVWVRRHAPDIEYLGTREKGILAAAMGAEFWYVPGKTPGKPPLVC